MPYASGRVIDDADAHIMVDLMGAGLVPELRAAA